jgi:hypothetical protein
LFDAPSFVKSMLCQLSQSLEPMLVHDGPTLQVAQGELDRQMRNLHLSRYLLGNPVLFHAIYKPRYGESMSRSWRR